jgi:hypothetical protein
MQKESWFFIFSAISALGGVAQLFDVFWVHPMKKEIKNSKQRVSFVSKKKLIILSILLVVSLILSAIGFLYSFPKTETIVKNWLIDNHYLIQKRYQDNTDFVYHVFISDAAVIDIEKYKNQNKLDIIAVYPLKDVEERYQKLTNDDRIKQAIQIRKEMVQLGVALEALPDNSYKIQYSIPLSEKLTDFELKKGVDVIETGLLTMHSAFMP